MRQTAKDLVYEAIIGSLADRLAVAPQSEWARIMASYLGLDCVKSIKVERIA